MHTPSPFKEDEVAGNEPLGRILFYVVRSVSLRRVRPERSRRSLYYGGRCVQASRPTA